MKQPLTRWAIIAAVFMFSPALSAQNPWLPIPKEWVLKMWQLWIDAKKIPVKTASVTEPCAISNEITIIVRCADGLKKTELVEAKPIQ
jgi:hypothetical protein